MHELGNIYQPLFNTATEPFTASPEMRLKHLRVIGKTGTGKSTFIANSILQDIYAGHGCSLFDPHKDLAELVLAHIPPQRRRDVIYFDPTDREWPIGLNVLEFVKADDRPLVASILVDAFRHIWGDSWGPQLEQILYNACAAVLDTDGGTLLGVKYMLISPAYRVRVLKAIRDPEIRNFWSKDFSEHMPEREQRERTLSTLNKVGQLIADPMLRNIIGQGRNRIDFKAIFDTKKIFIANLSQGAIGLGKSKLLGSLLLAKFHAAALARTDRTPFYMYFDEFHNYGSSSFIEMFSGIRKYGVSLTVAHQYLDQLSPELRAAVLGTVGTTVAFRIGADDATHLAPEFDRSIEQFVSLRPFHAYAKDGGSAVELEMPPITFKHYPSAITRIVANTRNIYAVPRVKIEDRITRFLSAI